MCNNRSVTIPDVIVSNGSIEIVGSICGDVDRNGDVNILDVRLLMNHLSHPEYPVDLQAGDVTGDGYIDSEDVRLLVRHVFNSISGIT